MNPEEFIKKAAMGRAKESWKPPAQSEASNTPSAPSAKDLAVVRQALEHAPPTTEVRRALFALARLEARLATGPLHPPDPVVREALEQEC